MREMFEKNKLSIFNKKTKDSFLLLNKEEKLNAFNKASKITDSVVIRNVEDTMINIALNGRGLNVFNNTATSLKQFLDDYRLIPEEHRAERVLVFDTETTDKYNAYAVSIALIVYNLKTKEIEKEIYSLINPQDYIRAEAIDVHGITNEQVMNAQTFENFIQEFENFLIDIDFLVGHNLNFDINVIEREYQRLNKVNPLLSFNVFDTMFMSKEIVNALDVKGKLKNPRLEECVSHFNIPVEDGTYHNALYDTKQTLEVFKNLIEV